MKLFKRLQEKLLQRDLNKNKTVGELVKKYPVSLLVEKNVLKRYKDTAFYCADIESGVLDYCQYTISTQLYTISGENIGKEVLQTKEYITKQEGAPKYMIIRGFAKFENTERESSYAVYDRNGECVIPHGCYQEAFMTENYTILSMPEKEEGKDPVCRISNDQDEKYMQILGNHISPYALIVGENKIITTKYARIFPIRENRFSDTNEYPTNAIWLAQQGLVGAKALKIDKKLSIRETFKFADNYVDRKNFFFDENSNAVYYLNNKNGTTRVNLRNGDEVDLLSLKKIEKTKTTSNKTESGLLHSSMLFADDHTVL